MVNLKKQNIDEQVETLRNSLEQQKSIADNDYDSLDKEYQHIKEETEKLGIKEFEEYNRSLAQALFNGEMITTDQQKMLDYIMDSGTYGTLEHDVENKLGKTNGKLKYLTRRVFGPVCKNDPYREHFMKRYAFFFDHRILLPVLPFYRLFRAMKNHPKRIQTEMNALIKTRKDR